MPGTDSSSCQAGTPLADGTSCGGGRVCMSGVCTGASCGDGTVSSGEQCDDGNLTDGDGCDSDCTWTCTSNPQCRDTNTCNGNERCVMPSTLMSRCVNGTPPADGATCNADGMASTRDICRMMTCVRSRCGDSFIDMGAMLPEQCDDGNTMNGDGCSSTCQTEAMVMPTGFRVTSLRLISPRITAQIPLGGCQDITDNCPMVFGSCASDSVNTLLATALRPMSVMMGDYSLHIVNLFRPLNPAAATTPGELHLNAACMEAPTPDSCGPDPMPDTIMASLNNQSSGTCFMPVAADVNTRAGTPATYMPTANTVSAPCFVSDPVSLTVSIGGIMIPLEDARVAATYTGTPPNRLVSGIVVGFLSEAAAVATTLPTSLPVVGGDPLYEHLQAGNRTVMGTADGCNVSGGAHEDDADMNGSVSGFWFFLNFEAERITWTGP
jgi:cysteine-rich repeat protein